MKHNIKYILFFTVLLAVISCGDMDYTEEDLNEIRMECSNNAFTDQSDIILNLIGDWKLIDQGCGFCVPFDDVRGDIRFDNHTASLSLNEDGNITEIDFTWEVEELLPTEWDSIPRFRLVTEPSHYSLVFNNFCKEIIYFDHRAFDGHMFMYKKE